MPKRWAIGLYFLGGALGNIAVIGAVIWLHALDALPKLLPAGRPIELGILVGIQILYIALSVVAPSFYAAQTKPYREGTTRPAISAGSGAYPSIAYRAARGDRRSWKALQRRLAKGGLPPEEEMFMLDSLIASGLMLAESGLRPQLDTWSLRALQLGPNSKRLIAKRGAVLVDLGLHREGKALLEAAASADQISPRDSFMRRMFLARAELVQGNTATAHALITQANAIMPQIGGGKRRSVKALEEWARQQAAELQRYRARPMEAPMLSVASLRMTYQLGRVDASKDDEAQHDVWETLVREFALGGMLPEEEMFLIDQLVTDGLISAAPLLRSGLDEWSLRAVQLGPQIRTLAASRGAVVVELGRYQEGKLLLEPFASAVDMPPFEAFMSRVFLARAEHALGNSASADRLISEAQAILATSDGKPKLVALIERIENEMQIEGRH